MNISEVNRQAIYRYSLAGPNVLQYIGSPWQACNTSLQCIVEYYSMDVTLQAYHTRSYWNNIVYTLYSTVCTLMHSVVFWCDMYALNMWFCCALSLFTLLCCAHVTTWFCPISVIPGIFEGVSRALLQMLHVLLLYPVPQNSGLLSSHLRNFSFEFWRFTRFLYNF